MARSQQEQKIVPVEFDAQGLDKLTTLIQLNFERVYDNLHTHGVKTAAPASTDGAIGDVFLVDLSGTPYIYAKLSSGWARVALTYI